MPARGADDGHAAGDELVGEVLGGSDAVAQVRLLHHLLEPARDGFEVVPGQPPVGGKPLGEDQQVPRLLGPPIVVQRQEAADVG